MGGSREGWEPRGGSLFLLKRAGREAVGGGPKLSRRLGVSPPFGHLQFFSLTFIFLLFVMLIFSTLIMGFVLIVMSG